MNRIVVFYRTSDGKCPVEDFLESLPGKVAQKIVWVLKLLEDLDVVPSLYFKKLIGTDEIWECRIQKEDITMSDLKKYMKERRKRDKEFAEGFEEGYEQFKIGVMLRQAREKAGLTQEELARRLKTKKTSISRIENHAEDIKLSTLKRTASALGKRLQVSII